MANQIPKDQMKVWFLFKPNPEWFLKRDPNPGTFGNERFQLKTSKWKVHLSNRVPKRVCQRPKPRLKLVGKYNPNGFEKPPNGWLTNPFYNQVNPNPNQLESC